MGAAGLLLSWHKDVTETWGGIIVLPLWQEYGTAKSSIEAGTSHGLIILSFWRVRTGVYSAYSRQLAFPFIMARAGHFLSILNYLSSFLALSEPNGLDFWNSSFTLG